MEYPIIEHGDSLVLSNKWPDPVVIMSDGPYGVDGYDGDLLDYEDLASWYEPHISNWAKRSSALTTLWFWNTEVGWAEVHPILKKHGWIYRSCNIWDKGLAHIAGNSNTKTLRRFPVVSEICAHYIRQPRFILDGNGLSAQDWLRAEWKRTKLPFSEANTACGVKNAATRKYLTNDHLWYFPPPEVFEKLVMYANEHGDPIGRPHFSLDGMSVLSGSQWEQLRGKFYCEPGVTNVWSIPAVRDSERIKCDGRAVHPNQKPMSIMCRLIKCSSDENDVVWEPFGGLATAAIASTHLGRRGYAAEIDIQTFSHAKKRIENMTENILA